MILPKFEVDEISGDYPNKAWADRKPKVLRGTSVTSDNYWKGKSGHLNAETMMKVYKCADPYAVSEMEDIAVARAAKRFGYLNKLIDLRVSVNLDVFTSRSTPESLWGSKEDSLASDDSEESVDIFSTAIKNNFEVGKVIIDDVLNK